MEIKEVTIFNNVQEFENFILNSYGKSMVLFFISTELISKRFY